MQKTDNEQPIRQKIIMATIECIERDGLQATTNRGIAQQAGVNSAAINYYFGSKENLLEQALDMTMQTGFGDLDEHLGDKTGPALRTALEDFFIEFFGNSLYYPNLARAHLAAPMLENNYDTRVIKGMRGFLENLVKALAKITPDKTAAETEAFAVQLLSGIVLHSILPHAFDGFGSFDIRNAETRERCIRMQFSGFLGPAHDA